MAQYLRSNFILYTILLVIVSGCDRFSASSVQNTPTIEAPTATITDYPEESSESIPTATTTANPEDSSKSMHPMHVCSPYSPPRIETSTNIDIREIMVTNATIDVNGNTNNIDTLLSNPGADGISIREAIIAGNNTPGPKSIKFSPEMKGSVIQITESAGNDLTLRSGHFTIDGDVDGDDNADITLDGSRGMVGTPSASSIYIASSYNTITGMIFKDFQNDTIKFLCSSQECANKTYTENKIIGNTITSQYTSGGISITPVGLPEELPEFTGIIWQDTLIQDNTIAVVGEAGIVINPGMGGAAQNRVGNLTISNNHISGSIMGIVAVAADVASDYFGITEPIYYSDHNSIENLIISGNTIEKTLEGIVLAASADGDRINLIQNTLITNNEITGGEWGIVIHSGGSGGSERSTSGNIIYNTIVRCNSIHDTENGIGIRSGHDPGGNELNDNTGTIDNIIGLLEISDNQIRRYSKTAIQIIAGFGDNPGSVGALNNLVEGVLITRNLLEPSSKSYAGLEIIAGWGNSSLADGNAVQNISILTNSINNNLFGISIIGGKGAFAKNSIVHISVLAGNVFRDNDNDINTITDIESATGNEIQIPNLLP